MNHPSTLRKSSYVVLSLAFSLTGAGTVMLGILLPILSGRWHLQDGTAGFLLFLQFAGSSLGAILTGKHRVRALRVGYGILIASAGALVLAAPPLVFAAFFFWGLGLGMAMTGTSLYVSDRAGDRRAPILERLNFAWSAGAMAAPLVFLHFLKMQNPRPLYWGFGTLFVFVAAWVVLREREEFPAASREGAGASEMRAGRMAIVSLVILAMCAVGVETSLSGWLTTYSHRADPRAATGGAVATACFLTGMLISRFVFSTRLLAMLGRSRLLSITLATTAASVTMLIAAHHGLAIDAAAALGGIGIGPVYPLLLSYLLEHTPSGWVFAVAGLGSAVFPWTTGVLSERLGSLRMGLMIPLLGAAVMIVLRVIAIESDQRRAGATWSEA